MTNGADEDTPTSEQPTAPTAPPPPGPPPRSGGWLLPRWAVAALVGLVAVGVLLGSGIAIGRATANGGGDDESSVEDRSGGRTPSERGEEGEERSPQPASGVFLGVATEFSTDPEGAQIVSVVPESPAAGAGLQEGDVITAVAGSAVTGPADLAVQVRRHEPGDQVTVAYTRDGNAAEVQVELGDRSAETEPSN
jgi:membrane-associated protease RseP (regulator of RpoE activity)